MYLHDLYESQPVPKDRYDEKSDKTGAKPRHTRKIRLTLEQINKLRRMNSIRKLEQTDQDKFFKEIYGAKPEQPGM
jgi:hypothetical protein